MNREEKQKFVEDCLDQTKAAILKKLDNVPEHWDGHELRAWMTIDMARNIGAVSVIYVQPTLCDLRNPRVKAFRNDLLTLDL